MGQPHACGEYGEAMTTCNITDECMGEMVCRLAEYDVCAFRDRVCMPVKWMEHSLCLQTIVYGSHKLLHML